MAPDLLKGLTGGIMEGLDALFTSDEEREKVKLEVMKTLQQPHILQAMTNIEEAKHKSIFVAGWRPAVGWVAVTGLAYHFLVFPFAGLITRFIDPSITLPEIGNAGELMTLVLSLLGLGAMRTYEKRQGVSREKL
jgi:hypothetical protein